MADSPALRRVTDLFIEGTELVLDERDPVLVWINKLNPFQTDEARKDGQAARTRLTLAMSNPLSEDSQLFDANASRLSDEVIAKGMAQTRYQEFLVEVSDELRVDEEWKDKANLLDRAAEQLAHLPAGHAELKQLDDVSEDYFGEMTRRTDARRDSEYESLIALPRDELRARYRDQWIEQQGTQAFLAEFRITEIWYSLRECFAPGKLENGRWDHSKCDHRVKLVDDREQIRQLPDGLIVQARQAIEALQIDDRTAKGSAAAPSSSESSPRPNEQETSAPSGPAETSPAPATTSTPQ